MHNPWLVCLAAALFFFYEIFQLTVFNTLSQHLMQFFNIKASKLSTLSAAYLYSCILAIIPAGLLFDRYSTRQLLLLAATLCLLGIWLMATTDSYSLAILGRILMGIGNPFSLVGCMRLASRWFPPERKALVMGFIMTIAMTGGIISQAPFNWLIDKLGWQQALLVSFYAGVLITILMTIFIKDSPNPLQISTAKASIKELWRGLKQAGKNSQNWLSGLYTSMVNLPVVVLGALWGNLYLTQGRHVTHHTAANLISCLFFGIVIGAPLFGLISDRLQSRRYPMASCALLAMVTVLAILYLPNSLFLLYGLFFLLGLLSGGQTLGYTVTAESNLATAESTSTSIVAIFVNSGAMLAQLGFAKLMDMFWDGKWVNGVPVYSANSFNYSMLMLPIGFSFALLTLLMLQESYGRK